MVYLTKEIFGNRKEVFERDYHNLIEKYFILTKRRKSQDASKELIDKIMTLYYSCKSESTDVIRALSDFRLIDELPGSVDIFIETDDFAAEIWKQFLELRSIKDSIKRKNKFRVFKSKFREYIISVNRKYFQNIKVSADSIAHIPHETIHMFYDERTGFKRKKGSSAVFI